MSRLTKLYGEMLEKEWVDVDIYLCWTVLKKLVKILVYKLEGR